MPRLVLRGAGRPGAGSVDGAAVVEHLLELGGGAEDADGAGGGGGAGGVGRALPADDEGGAGEGLGEAVDGVDVEGEAAVEAAAADVGEGSQGPPALPERSLLGGGGRRGVMTFRVRVCAAGGDGAGRGEPLGVEGEGFA